METFNSLAPRTRKALQWAACIGRRFDLVTLSLLLEKKFTEVEKILAEALFNRLIFFDTNFYEIGSLQREEKCIFELGIWYQFLDQELYQCILGTVDPSDAKEAEIILRKLKKSQLYQLLQDHIQRPLLPSETT